MSRSHSRIAQTGFDKAFEAVNIFVLLLILMITLVPFLVVIQRSMVPPEEVMLSSGGLSSFLPRKVTFDYYRFVANNPVIWRAYGVTIIRTLLGTFINLLISVLTAYPLSKKRIPGNKIIMLFFFITMIFNGGMIPTY